MSSPRTFAHKSLDGWSAAINLFSAFFNREVSAAEKDFWRRFKKGFKRMTPKGVAKVKGAITRDMMQEMLASPRIFDAENIRDGLMLQHAGGLRTSEVELVRVSNPTFDEAPKILYRFSEDERPHQSERNELLIEYHYTSPRGTTPSNDCMTAQRVSTMTHL